MPHKPQPKPPQKTGRPAKAPEVLHLTETSIQQIATLETIAKGVVEFIAGMRVFFRRADEIEALADQSLDAARLMAKPTSKADDEAVQMAVREWATQKKEAEHFWSPITKLLHGAHRLMTGRRDRALKLLDEAQEIGTRFHQQWVREETERTNAENRRRAQEAEQAAQAERDIELAALEREAARREAASPDLSAREAAFVDLMVGQNLAADLAATRAGFKWDNAASRLLGMKKIQAAVKASREAKAVRDQATAIAAQPLQIQDAIAERPQVGEAATDRRTWRGEIVDEQAFVAAVCEGRLGIPRDLLQINPKRLNEEARSLKELLNRWPGVRAVYKDTIV